MNMDTTTLEHLGFTKGEIKVYLTLLPLGNTTTGPIILKSNVSRSKVYEILERLKEKGLVSETIQKDTRYFQALSPHKILDYLTIKEEQLLQQKTAFTTILPDLIAKQTYAAEKEGVKVYVGLESIKTFYREMLAQLGNESYLGINFSDKVLANRSLMLTLHKIHKERAKKGIKAKILFSKHGIKKTIASSDIYECKVVDDILPNDVAIFNDTVATFSWGETPKVFAIISQDNAKKYKQFFYHFWKKAKPL